MKKREVMRMALQIEFRSTYEQRNGEEQSYSDIEWEPIAKYRINVKKTTNTSFDFKTKLFDWDERMIHLDKPLTVVTEIDLSNYNITVGYGRKELKKDDVSNWIVVENKK